MNVFPVVVLNGLRPDSLGIYLASLGLISLVARKWPKVRAVWRDASFCLVGGPATLEQTVEFVSEIGKKNGWTRYDKPWDKVKKADVDKKISMNTARWRALEVEEGRLSTFGAHLALEDRIRMNPLLGTGGNAGKRDFSKGWKDAVHAIEKPPRKWSREALNDDLLGFLSGGASTCLGSFGAGSWFGAANKIYNHGNVSTPPDSPRGKKQPYREGELSPWAMALACEGLPFFSGSPSRQLGSQRQPKGAFPFVTTAMAPRFVGESGGVEAEIWAPIWSQPTTVPELRSLFLRGRAEIGGKGAVSSAAFAAGIIGRGVDAGVVEFRRFLLLHTTSAQTFESRLGSVVPVPSTSLDEATTRSMGTIVGLLNGLPADRKVGQRWRFAGVRGPLEQALIDFAAAWSGKGRIEQAWELVDQVIEALTKVDRNRMFRSHNVRFRLLLGQWAMQLFKEDPPEREARLALAISSLAKTPSSPEFIAYRIGVRRRTGRFQWEFPESAPARRMWRDVGLTENLGSIAERRVVEALQNMATRPPFSAWIRVTLDDLHAWMSGAVDEGRMRVWLDRLCIFDWGSNASREAARELQRSFTRSRPIVDGELAQYALFRPLVSDWLLHQILQESGIRSDRATTCGCLAQVMAMLRRGDMSAAIEVALDAYRGMGVPLADFGTFPAELDSERMLAALLIPARDQQILAMFRRWRSPTEPKE